MLLDAHGTKGFDELLQPAIRCAEEGFPVHPRVAWDWSLQVEKLRRAGNKLFLPGGRAPREGDLFVQKALGGTLRAIAARGADAFYSGPVAADMAATLKRAGGAQTEEDFANGRKSAEFVAPIHINWRGLDVWQCPPNGPGIVALMILGQLEALGPAPDGPDGATPAPPPHRGCAPRLPRPRRLPRRPAPARNPGRPADRARLSRGARPPHR